MIVHRLLRTEAACFTSKLNVSFCSIVLALFLREWQWLEHCETNILDVVFDTSVWSIFGVNFVGKKD